MEIEGIVKSMQVMQSRNGPFLFIKVNDFTVGTCNCQFSAKHPNYKNFVKTNERGEHILSNNLTNHHIKAIVSASANKEFVNLQIHDLTDLDYPDEQSTQ